MIESSLLAFIFSAAITIILAAVVFFFLRRQHLVHSSGDGMRILQQLPVGQRERLVLVEFSGQRLLLGVTPHHIGLLREMMCDCCTNKVGTKVLNSAADVD